MGKLHVSRGSKNSKVGERKERSGDDEPMGAESSIGAASDRIRKESA
jgi:hypothetical protein